MRSLWLSDSAEPARSVVALHGLARYVFDSSVDPDSISSFSADHPPGSRSDIENEDVALNGRLRMPHQIRAVNLVRLLDRDIIRVFRILHSSNGEIIERSVPGLFVAVAPVEESSDARETNPITIFFHSGLRCARASGVAL